MNSPLPLKCFFRGRLEFGTDRTFEKVKQHYLNRIETMYRNDVIFTLEEHFLEEEKAIELTRETLQLPEKAYRKTMDLLKELSQYGLAGRVKGWAIDSGRVIGEDIISPDNTKDAVVTYQEAIEKYGMPGSEIAAIELLSQSLESFNRNPLAYDRRGFMSYKLGKYKDAIIDFEKSISIFKDNPEPHYGLARCYEVAQEWDKMKTALETAKKASLPRESIYHTSRLYLGIALYELGETEAAKVELNEFVKRPYNVDDDNYRKLYLGHKYLGKIFIRAGDDNKSLEHFNISYALKQGGSVSECVPQPDAAPVKKAKSQAADKTAKPRKAKKATNVAEPG